MKFRRQNLNNIKRRFEEQTGTVLTPRQVCHCRRSLRLALVMAVVLLGLGMLAFSDPIFSPLDGDSLSLSGSYEGNGIVSVFVENGSEKELRFQHQLKLYNWGTGLEIPQSGKPVFYNAVFPAGTSGVMTIDLSGAYDIPALEAAPPGESGTFYYYLLLTNQDFLFGQDWQCSFTFRQDEEVLTQEPDLQISGSSQAQTIGAVEEELRFYFERDYWDQIPAMNEANFTYLQKVREVLSRKKGVLVRPVDPMLVVGDVPETVVFDDRYPREEQPSLYWEQYSSLDGYNRVVGSSFNAEDSDKLLQIFGMIPRNGEAANGGGTVVPLIFLATYETAATKQEGAYAFLYGQTATFDELENRKVYEDEQYTVYQVTDFFYEDLDGYLDYFQTTSRQLSIDAPLRKQLKNIYDYFMKRENIQPLFYYNLPR